MSSVRLGHFIDSWDENGRQKDHQSAFDYWIQTIKANTVRGTPQEILAQTRSDHLKSIQLGRVDVFHMYGYDFVQYKAAWKLEGLMAPLNSSASYVIITAAKDRKSEEILTLDALENKTIAIEVGGRGALPYWFLQSEVRSKVRGYRSYADFERFAKLRYVDSALEAVIPVFFGEAEACVVSLSGLQSALVVNEQMRAGLRIDNPLAQSAELLSHVIACRQGVLPGVKAEVIRLSQTPPANRAILSGAPLVGYEERQTEGLKKLYQSLLDLKQGEAGPRTPPVDSKIGRAEAMSSGAKISGGDLGQ